jgi:hypothetical protein
MAQLVNEPVPAPETATSISAQATATSESNTTGPLVPSSQPSSTTAHPASPTHARKHSTSLNDTVPLEHPSRTHPIHPALSSLPLLPQPPSAATSTINPLTLQPFTPAELTAHKYDDLRARFVNPSTSEGQPAAVAAAVNAAQVNAEQEDVVRQINARMEERARKEAEIDKEIGEKEKIREVERKIYRRKMGGKEGV